MSHNRERHEKNCLNCGQIVAGRYCQHCGQENAEPDVSFFGLIRHFFYDIIHFDGKYFKTVKYLVSRPGFLSSAFIKGKRAAHLDPARMYLFTSAIFFFLFFSVFLDASEKKMKQDIQYRNELVSDLILLDNKGDFDIQSRYIIRNKKDTLIDIYDTAGTNRFRDSVSELVKLVPANVKRPNVRFLGSNFTGTKAEYDSIQRALTNDQQDSWFKKQIAYQRFHVDKEYKGDEATYIAHLMDRFLHGFPTIFFLSLPLIALILKLLYFRHKNITLSHHGIYLVHLYIFTFLWMIAYFSVDELWLRFSWSFLKWLKAALFVWLIVYYYKAFKEFYKQGALKTSVKLGLTFVLSTILIILIAANYLGFTAWKG